MTAQLRHTIVLLISDESEAEDDLGPALAALGCIAHRAKPDSPLEATHHYDAALLAAPRNCDWSAGMLIALRSADLACASVIVLGSGGPEAIAESLRLGAVDCLVRPVGLPDLVESLTATIDCTRRWRARVSHARARMTAGSHSPTTTRAATLARVFEPVEHPADTGGDERIEGLVQRVAEQSGLTPREREVLYWLLRGHRYVDIATVLGVVPRTAKFHAANLLQKLNLDSRHDLSRLFAEEVEPDWS